MQSLPQIPHFLLFGLWSSKNRQIIDPIPQTPVPVCVCMCVCVDRTIGTLAAPFERAPRSARSA